MGIMAKLNRSIYTLLVLLPLPLLLSGCSWGSHELSNMSLVMAAGLDRTDDGKFKLTLQIFVPHATSPINQNSGSGGSTSTQSPVLVKSATGENMADAAVNLQQHLSRKIFWGQCDTYIVGEKLAKDGTLSEQIDFINRHPQPRTRANIYISRGSADNILSVSPTLDQYMGEVLEKVSDITFDRPITIKDFQQMSMSETTGGYLPLLQITKPKKPKKVSETSAEISGLAILKKGKMIGTIKGESMKGLIGIHNQLKLDTITGETPGGGKISLLPLQQHVKLVPKIKDGKWQVKIRVHIEGMLVQNDSYLNVMEPRYSKQAESYLEKKIEKGIHQSILEVKDQIGTDAFGFGEAFHRSYPKEWRKVKDHWDDWLPYIDYDIDTHLHIRDPGLVNKTIE